MESGTLFTISLPLSQELTDPERKQKLLAALEKLKEAIPKFSTASQNCVKHPNSTPAKVRKKRRPAAMAGHFFYFLTLLASVSLLYLLQLCPVLLQESRDALAGEISSAIHDLIDAVKTYEDFYPESEATENMAANIMEVCIIARLLSSVNQSVNRVQTVLQFDCLTLFVL